MRIIPVIDILGGVVVRAMAGKRSDYRPVVSRLTTSTEPAQVASALLKASGADELYIADLDAILGGEANGVPSVFPATVLLDAGLRSWQAIRDPNVRMVIGTETCTVPPERWPRPLPGILSLDLFDGALRCAWGKVNSLDELLECVESVIVLDLAHVGTGRGSGTEDKLRSIRKRWPGIELIAGGGVKDRDDLKRLEDAGADAALVASALHDGTLRFDR